jgi:hypothetical protein
MRIATRLVISIGAVWVAGGAAANVRRQFNHIFGIHPVSHFAFVARGRLDDGTAFDVRVVEVDLDLVRFDVRFG